jgi:hypothetical protein
MVLVGIPRPNAWRQVVIPLRKFTQARDKQFDLSTALGIGIYTDADFPLSFELYIDEIEVSLRGSNAPKRLCHGVDTRPLTSPTMFL